MRRIPVAACALLLLLTGLPAVLGASEEVWTVCPGPGEGCDATSIQEAVELAEDGDTIEVRPGTYTEAVTLDVDVDLVGLDEEDRPVLHGTLRNARDNLALSDVRVAHMVLENEGGLVEFAPGGTTLDGLTFENVDFQLTGDSTDPDSVITRAGDGSDLVIQGAGLTFQDVHMTTNGYDYNVGQGHFAWLQVNGGPVLFENVTFQGPNTNLNLGTGAEDVTLRNVSVLEGGSLYLSDNTGLVVEESTFQDVGLTLNGVVDGLVTGNTFQGIQGAKVIDVTADWGAQDNADIRIEQNTFQDLQADAIRIYTSSGWQPEEDFLTLRHNSFEIEGDHLAVANTFDTFTVDAAENWWGHPTGPSGQWIGLGAGISENVDFLPWCPTPGCLVLGTL